MQAVRDLSRAFALAVPSDDAMRIRDDVGFFQTVQSVLAKRTAVDTRPPGGTGSGRARSSPAL